MPNCNSVQYIISYTADTRFVIKLKIRHCSGDDDDNDNGSDRDAEDNDYYRSDTHSAASIICLL